MAMETQHSSHSCQESSATTGKSWKTREREREGERGRENLRKGERECVKNVRGKQGFFIGICFRGREAFPSSFPLQTMSMVLCRSAVQEQLGV